MTTRSLAILAVIALVVVVACVVFSAPIEVTAISFIAAIALLFALGYAAFEHLESDAPSSVNDVGEELPHSAKRVESATKGQNGAF